MFFLILQCTLFFKVPLPRQGEQMCHHLKLELSPIKKINKLDDV